MNARDDDDGDFDLLGEPDGYETHEYNGVTILFRRRDRYADGTAMCRAGRKFFAHYREKDGTERFLAAAAAAIGIPIATEGAQPGLIQFQRGRSRGGITWVHPWVAVDLATWVNEQFHVWVCVQIDDMIRGGKRTVADLLRDVDDVLFEQLRRQHEAAFAERHLDAVVAWIPEHVESFRGATLVRTEPWTDVEGADLVVLEPRGGCGPATRIAVRCRRRRFAKYAERGDFTIRPSERPKILEGNARFYFYGIVDQDDEPGRFAHAAFLDLNAFRFLTAQPQDGLLVYNTREKYLPDLVVAAENWPPGPPRPRLFGYDA